jgi:alkylation response protein AidB-like acyl-CoA dehydrogenase
MESIPMNLTLAEQHLLQRVDEWLQVEVAPQVAAWAQAGTSSAHLMPSAARLGLLGLQVPTSHGGLGLSFACKAQVCEHVARHDMGLAMAWVNTHNVAEQLVRLKRTELVEAFVPRLLAGSLIACTALTEPGAGSDLSLMQTHATAQGAGWTLQGAKTWITNARDADLFVVYAHTDAARTYGGMAAFLVQAQRAGFARHTELDPGPIPSLGTGGFDLDGYACAASEVVSPPGEALKDILGAINGARVYVAAMCCGMVDQCLRIAAAYGLTRQTFGQPLWGHQGWRWALADAAIELDAARLLITQAAARIDAGMDAQVASAKAKVFATRMAQRHIAAMLHAMGAEGLRESHPFVRHLQAAQVAGFVDGSTEMLLERIAKDFKSPGLRA